MAHVHQPLPLPSALIADIEPKLEASLLKALAKDPDDRFQSAREMMQAVAMASGLSDEAEAGDEAAATAVLDLEAMGTLTDAATAAMDTSAAPTAGCL